jgi:hypothetical protein
MTNETNLEFPSFIFRMASSLLICSVDGCKRAVTCLCRHCQKDVCAKHFNEHQIQVNDQLIPVTDRLNECNKQKNSILSKI